MSDQIEKLIQAIPKAELHCHIEGTLEPEMIFEFAKRNKIKLPYNSPEEIKEKYKFDNLQSFLNIYYEGMSVLRTEQDFYDLTWAYLTKAKQNNVVHCEIFFDPQAHLIRGVPFSAVINGIDRALKQAEKELQITNHLILCFLRDRSAEEAMQTLEQALPYKDKLIAVGLDSAEMGHPPSKFIHVFHEAEKAGLLTCAHAGEEGPPAYMWEAIRLLHVSRIEHGVQCIHDEDLMAYLKDTQLPLTVCPISNVKLRVFDQMKNHNIKILLDKGLCVCVNSDDPSYFGGYVTDNFLAVHRALNLTEKEVIQLAKNSIQSSFISEAQKKIYLNKIDLCKEG